MWVLDGFADRRNHAFDLHGRIEPARLRHRSNDETALTEGRGHAVGLYSRFKWRWKLAALPFDRQRSSPRVAARRCSLLRRREPVFPSNPAPQYPATALAKLADRDPADGACAMSGESLADECSNKCTPFVLICQASDDPEDIKSLSEGSWSHPR